MTATPSDFTTAAAEFFRTIVVPSLQSGLAALETTRNVAGHERVVASVVSWANDFNVGRDAAALAPAQLARALETIWLLAVVEIMPNVDKDARFVDIVLLPDLTRPLDLAVAAADALDMLRGSSVGEVFRRRQAHLVDLMATAMADQMAGVAGTA